jgi:hypothetical protein
MAEGIFRDLAKKPEYEGKIGRIDSCGTGEGTLLGMRLTSFGPGCPCVSLWGGGYNISRRALLSWGLTMDHGSQGHITLVTRQTFEP